MTDLYIREYQAQDWPRLMAIHDSARRMELELAGLEGAFVPLEIAAFREGLFDYTVRVALLEDEVVGFVAYSEEELAWLYVDPERMGRGIGKRLISYVIEHTGERPLSVEVLTGNLPAVGLYQSFGFEIVEECSGVMPGNEDFPVTVYQMEKS